MARAFGFLRSLPWFDIGKSTFTAFSCLTVTFATYIFYFHREVFIFVNGLAFLNFIFQTSILASVSFGLAKILLFFLVRYVLAFFENFISVLVSIFVLVLARFASRFKLDPLRALGLRLLILPDELALYRQKICALGDSFLAPYFLGAVIFLFAFLESTAIFGLLWLFGAVSIGYLTYSLNLAYVDNRKEFFPNGETEAVSVSFLENLKLTVRDLLDAQREFTDVASRSIFLGLQLSEIFPVAFNLRNFRNFIFSFWGLIALTLAAPLGYLRGQVVELTSTYVVELTEGELYSPRYQYSDGYLKSGISIFLTTGNSVIAKHRIDGEILVIPFESIQYLKAVDTDDFWSSGFSGGRM